MYFPKHILPLRSALIRVTWTGGEYMSENFGDEMSHSHFVFFPTNNKRIRKLVQEFLDVCHIQIPVYDYASRRFVPTCDLNFSSCSVEFAVRNQERTTIVHN